MMDEVERLAALLNDLDGEPLERHPEALERVRRGIVKELEALGASLRAPVGGDLSGETGSAGS